MVVKALTYQVLVEQIIGEYLAVLRLQQTLELKEIQAAVLVVAVEQMPTLQQVLVVMVFQAVAAADVIQLEVEQILVVLVVVV